VPSGFGSIEYPRLAGPCPCVLLREIQEASDRADHAHSRAVLTVSVPVPPAAGAGELLPLIETPHLVIDGPATLTLVELPQPVTASTAMQPARRKLAPRVGRVEHTIGDGPRRPDTVCNSRDHRDGGWMNRPRSAIGHVSNYFATRLLRLRRQRSISRQAKVAAAAFVVGRKAPSGSHFCCVWSFFRQTSQALEMARSGDVRPQSNGYSCGL
jgi:hypothetical protein